MFRLHILGRTRPLASVRAITQYQTQKHRFSDIHHDPLRILFCGADEFSIYSLRAICQLRERMPEKIGSIDIVCRPDKWVGRGLKQIQEVPIKSVANELGLPLHQLDTFTGWSLPSSADLIIAVSFGLLVPSRLLNAATYGGLNVHPSLLPDLRGPAPIQHALLRGHSHTGVTLQTMHPNRFDHGAVLAQTPAPGIQIPQHATPDLMVKLLGPLGAEILSRSIEHGVSLRRPTKETSEGIEPSVHSHAPKITPEDRHIDWRSWSAEEVLRRDRVLGRLWDTETYTQCMRGQAQEPKRVTFFGPWRKLTDEGMLQVEDHGRSPGKPSVFHPNSSQQPIFALRTLDGQHISPASATVEGGQGGKGLLTLMKSLNSA